MKKLFALRVLMTMLVGALPAKADGIPMPPPPKKKPGSVVVRSGDPLVLADGMPMPPPPPPPKRKDTVAA